MSMNYPEALAAVISGSKVSRTGWNGKDMWIEAQWPDESSKMTQPYIYMFTADKQLIPWLCSQADAFANDWGVVA